MQCLQLNLAVNAMNVFIKNIYSYEVCGKGYNYKSDLVDHNATHYSSRPFKS